MTLRACTGSLTTVKRPPRGTVPVISGPFHWPRAPVALAGKRRRCTATGREPHSSFSGLSIRTYSSAVVVLLSFTVSLQLQYIAPSAITQYFSFFSFHLTLSFSNFKHIITAVSSSTTTSRSSRRSPTVSSSAELEENNTFVNNTADDSHHIQIKPPDPFLSTTNNNTEQIEPMDLSCVKISNSNMVKRNNYFEPNSDTPLPLPSNINEATLLILKSVYDIKYHRKPNCDQIFHEDPANPKLYVCKVCAKHVRSKWHHFQTHYSRDHKCSDCDAVYSRIDTLRTHAKKRHHTVIPRYYYGIPANVWHRVVVQLTDPLPRPARPKPTIPHSSAH